MLFYGHDVNILELLTIMVALKLWGNALHPMPYQTFFDLIGKDLLNSYNDSFHKGSLSITQKRGSITLIPKGDINLTYLKIWRPISLLNVDY